MEKIKNCDICGENTKIDNYGNGKCKNCGWNNDENAVTFPNSINPPNFTSLNEAKNNYKNKLKYKPTFDRIVDLVDRGFDIIIKYKKSLYQLSKHDDFTIWEVDTNNYKSYKSFDEFKSKANINDIPLKDLWKNIKFIKYDC